MKEDADRLDRKLYRLWSLPLVLVGLMYFMRGIGGNMPLAMFGAGKIFMAMFAFHNNVYDWSPRGFDPSLAGRTDAGLLICGVLPCLVAFGLMLMT